MKKKQIEDLVLLGDDFVAAIKNAAWGDIRRPTMHMSQAIDNWEVYTCHLPRKKRDE